MKTYIFSALFITLLSSCETSNLSFVTTRPINKQCFATNGPIVSSQAEASDLAEIYFLVPTKQMASHASAANELFKSTGGNLIRNAEISWGFWYIPYIYGRETAKIKGDIVKMPYGYTPASAPSATSSTSTEVEVQVKVNTNSRASAQ